MDERERRLRPRVLQVGVVAQQLRRREHALVDDRAARERRDHEVRPGRQLGHAADHVELALERVLVARQLGRRGDDELLDVGREPVGGDADVVLLDRDVAPGDDALALGLDRLGEQPLELVRGAPRSCGRKQTATPYCPAGGRSAPTTPRISSSGICSSMPAPSPVFGSAPAAPRCSRFSRAVIARWTVSWLGSPLSRATNATPQASCSYPGSYSPTGSVGRGRGGKGVLPKGAAWALEAGKVAAVRQAVRRTPVACHAPSALGSSAMAAAREVTVLAAGGTIAMAGDAGACRSSTRRR